MTVICDSPPDARLLRAQLDDTRRQLRRLALMLALTASLTAIDIEKGRGIIPLGISRGLPVHP